MFAAAKLEHQLEAVEYVILIGNPNWEQIWQEHSSHYPTRERTAELLKLKFLELAHKKCPLVILTVLLTFVLQSKFTSGLLFGRGAQSATLGSILNSRSLFLICHLYYSYVEKATY